MTTTTTMDSVINEKKMNICRKHPTKKKVGPAPASLIQLLLSSSSSFFLLLLLLISTYSSSSSSSRRRLLFVHANTDKETTSSSSTTTTGGSGRRSLLLHDHPLIKDWFLLSFPDTYVSSKVGWRFDDEHDEQHEPQLVALEDIQRKEILMTVPRSIQVTGSDLSHNNKDNKDNNNNDNINGHHEDPNCAFTDFLVEQLRKGESSPYYPYLHKHVLSMVRPVTTTEEDDDDDGHDDNDGKDDILSPYRTTRNDTKYNHILQHTTHPLSSWSITGLSILKHIVNSGGGLFPDLGEIDVFIEQRKIQIWDTHTTYRVDCNKKHHRRPTKTTTTNRGGGDDHQQDYYIVQKELPPSRQFWHELLYQDYVMTPFKLSVLSRKGGLPMWSPLVYDLIIWPHRNGKWQNLKALFRLSDDNPLDVFATRDIPAGEPLYLSLGGSNPDRDGRSLQELLRPTIVEVDGTTTTTAAATTTTNNSTCYQNYETIGRCVTTQDIFAYAGIVEEYPRQWYFEVDIDVPTWNMLVEIDIMDSSTAGTGTAPAVPTLRWLYPHPSSNGHPLAIEQKDWILAQRNRIRNRRDAIQQVVETDMLRRNITTIPDDGDDGNNVVPKPDKRRMNRQLRHEGGLILSYLDAYSEALELAWTYRDDVVLPKVTTDADDGSDLTATAADADAGASLLSSLDPLDIDAGNTARNVFICAQHDAFDHDGWFEEEKTFYQRMLLSHSDMNEETCLSQTGWIQVCSSFRPQYHEILSHIVTQYIGTNPGVKRVAFMGGGDSMILHEILKYPQLELVVGMELDQEVTRIAFSYFGSQPHFDDPRVEWWFGDVSKTLLALPLDYFQSFDVVIVDLLTFIADTLKVTPDLSVMDTALLLMRPDGGVIAKNEDFPLRANVGFAKYTVELEFDGIPRICELSATIGSNTVDFMKALPSQHEGVDSIFLDLTVPLSLPTQDDDVETYDRWNWYRHTPPNCKGMAEDIQNTSNDAVNSAASVNGTCSDSSQPRVEDQVGILMIVEAEQVQMTTLDDIKSVEQAIRQALLVLGLTEISVVMKENSNFLVFVLQEGYVAVRTHAHARYVGFDIMMWNGADRIDIIRKGVVAAVGGDGKESSTTSSFRFVTGGMTGAEPTCQSVTLSSIAISAKRSLCSAPNAHREPLKRNNDAFASAVARTPADEALQQVIDAYLSTYETSASIVAVFCGVEGTSCQLLDVLNDLALSSERSVEIHPIFTCNSTDGSSSNNSMSFDEELAGCAKAIRTQLDAVVSEGKKLDGIALDGSIRKTVGQVIHKTLADKRLFEALLKTESYLVLATVTNDTDSGSDWQRVFVDRFRSEFTLIRPAHRADLRFVFDMASQEKDTMYSYARYSLFKAGDNDFFLHLVNVVAEIEEKTNVRVGVDEVANGFAGYVTDHELPMAFKDSTYDKTPSKEQWSGQHSVGHQALFKFIVSPPREPVEVGERVLAVIRPGPWNATYGEAEVLAASVVKDDNGLPKSQIYSVRYLDNNLPIKKVTRDEIRKFSSEDSVVDMSFGFGDLVLFRRVDSDLVGFYENGMVFRTDSLPKGVPQEKKTYSIYQLETDGFIFHGIPQSNMIGQFESPVYLLKVPPMSAPQLAAALEAALTAAFVSKDSPLIIEPPVSVAAGAVFVAFWDSDSAVMKWDGNNGLEISLFTLEDQSEKVQIEFQNAFINGITQNYVKILSRDCFPRGFGRVVNLASDFEERPPPWLRNK